MSNIGDAAERLFVTACKMDKEGSRYYCATSGLCEGQNTLLIVAVNGGALHMAEILDQVSRIDPRCEGGE